MQYMIDSAIHVVSRDDTFSLTNLSKEEKTIAQYMYGTIHLDIDKGTTHVRHSQPMNTLIFTCRPNWSETGILHNKTSYFGRLSRSIQFRLFSEPTLVIYSIIDLNWVLIKEINGSGHIEFHI